MSWSALSDSGICSVRSDRVSGKVGSNSMTEMTWVIPRLVSCASSHAVTRFVRYNRGSTSLAICAWCKGSPCSLYRSMEAIRAVCWRLGVTILGRGEETIGGVWMALKLQSRVRAEGVRKARRAKTPKRNVKLRCIAFRASEKGYCTGVGQTINGCAKTRRR